MMRAVAGESHSALPFYLAGGALDCRVQFEPDVHPALKGEIRPDGEKLPAKMIAR